MSEFGLVVLGAHLGVHIKKEIEQTLPKKVLLVEPVPHLTKKRKKIFSLLNDHQYLN